MNIWRETRRMAISLTVLLAATLLLPGTLQALAQDENPERGDEVRFERLYPVAIHPGTCTGDLDAPAFDLGFTDLVGAADETDLGTIVGPDVMRVTSTLDISLDDLFSSPHAVVVHDPDDSNVMVACADFGGFVEGGLSAVTLVAVNDSGINGVAILDEDEGGLLGLLDNQVNVTVYVIKMRTITREGGVTGEGSADTADEAAAAAENASENQSTAEDVIGETTRTVEMMDFAFEPAEFSIAGNTEVAIDLPNSGNAVHTFNIDALNISTGPVQPEEAATISISAEPGEYTFYCNMPGHREAGMEGTLTVQ